MNWLNNLKLKAKLITAFTLLLGLMLCIGLFSVYQLGNTNAVTTELTTNWFPATVAIYEMEGFAMDFRDAEFEHILSTSKETRDHYEKEMADILENFKKSEVKYVALISSPEEQALYEAEKKYWNDYLAEHEKLLQLSRQNKIEEATAFMRGEMRKSFTGVEDSQQRLIDLNVKGGTDASTRGNETFISARRFIFGMMIGCIIFGLVAAIFLANLLSKPIVEVAQRLEQLRGLCVTHLGNAAEALKRGDLTYKIQTGTPAFEVTTSDEIGQLKTTFNCILNQTKNTVAAFEASRNTVIQIIEETRTVAESVRDGQFNARCNSDAVAGSFQELANTINQLVQNIATPLAEVGVVMEELAAQNLTAQVKGDYKGEYEKLKLALNRVCTTLNQTLSQVALSSEQVNSAASEISSGSQSLAQGASEQASSLEEISSSLQEMRAMIQQNASNAKEGRSLSEATRQTTDRGVTSMHNLTDAIDRIKASSDATAKIVKTIDEIAFQTNLLALNAAVEAARAGDAGKGFAVVADEVRALAMRSAEAARQTADLIEESVKNSDSGVALNREALSNLEEINQQVEKVSVVMTEIATSSQQQSQSVEQINAAVEQMNLVTQQAAANSEESAAAAEELSGQSQELSVLVGQFKLTLQDTSRRHSTPRAMAARAAAVGTKTFAKSMPQKPMVRAAKASASSFSAQTSAAAVIPFDDDSSTDALQEF